MADRTVRMSIRCAGQKIDLDGESALTLCLDEDCGVKGGIVGTVSAAKMLVMLSAAADAVIMAMAELTGERDSCARLAAAVAVESALHGSETSSGYTVDLEALTQIRDLAEELGLEVPDGR